jgi:hypothetical protein
MLWALAAISALLVNTTAFPVLPLARTALLVPSRVSTVCPLAALALLVPLQALEPSLAVTVPLVPSPPLPVPVFAFHVPKASIPTKVIQFVLLALWAPLLPRVPPLALLARSVCLLPAQAAPAALNALQVRSPIQLVVLLVPTALPVPRLLLVLRHARLAPLVPSLASMVRALASLVLKVFTLSVKAM